MATLPKKESVMQFEDVRPFLQRHHRGVITTHQSNGAAHASVVVCGAYEGQAAFVIVRGTSVKARNLRRDPRCTVLAVTADWRSWVSVEGQAQLFDYRNTDGETLRVMLRNVYRACGDKDHPDWDEYDQAMREQDAVVVLVRPERVYGQMRS
jgi:PPOX class probable F420-dependent enzyme